MTVQSHEIDRKSFSYILAYSVISGGLVDETQVPEDIDETYVEGFTYDDSTQDQGLLLRMIFTIRKYSYLQMHRFPAY